MFNLRRHFSKSPDELLSLCDLHDNEIGFMFRRLRTKSLVINRMSSIFVVKSSSQLYVQRRKMQKSWCPGYYDLTFGGLVRYGCNYEENAYRELMEELNIENVHLEPLFKYILIILSFIILLQIF
jgi:8-oxo-dGTP pyrophosphatase MutT (NUDIX family)